MIWYIVILCFPVYFLGICQLKLNLSFGNFYRKSSKEFRIKIHFPTNWDPNWQSRRWNAQLIRRVSRWATIDSWDFRSPKTLKFQEAFQRFLEFLDIAIAVNSPFSEMWSSSLSFWGWKIKSAANSNPNPNSNSENYYFDFHSKMSWNMICSQWIQQQCNHQLGECITRTLHRKLWCVPFAFIIESPSRWHIADVKHRYVSTIHGYRMHEWQIRSNRSLNGVMVCIVSHAESFDPKLDIDMHK